MPPGDLEGFVGGGHGVVDPAEARQHDAKGGKGHGAHSMSTRRLGHGEGPEERRLGFEIALLDVQLAAEPEEHHGLDLAGWTVGDQRGRLPPGISTARSVAG